MATLRRGLVDKVKKAASKVSTRGVQVASKAGTQGARMLVETTVAAVKTVDKLQEKLGRRSSHARFTEKAAVSERPLEALVRPPGARAAAPMPSKVPVAKPPKTVPVAKEPKMAVKTPGVTAKTRRATSPRASVAPPVELRDSGRKTMPAAAPKRAKKARAAGKQFKVKRGQKHLHSGR